MLQGCGGHGGRRRDIGGKTMRSFNTCGRRLWQGLSLATVLAAMLSCGAAAALAGECPPDKRMVDATKPSDMPAKDVVDKVLASIDLSKEKVQLADHLLRIRKLEIKPGGVVPWHSHADR